MGINWSNINKTNRVNISDHHENELITICINNINNYNYLNDEMIDYINKMNSEDKMKIIISLNKVLKIIFEDVIRN